jgi:hypothetical protein
VAAIYEGDLVKQRTVVRVVLAATAALLLLALLVARLGGDPEPEGAAPVVAGSLPGTTVAPTAPEPAPGGPRATTTAAPDAPAATTGAPTGRPASGGAGRLRIGAIGVDAAVVPVGVQANGEMEVPPATEVGWYRFGAAPGAAGSAVLAAHVDYDGVRGAFFRLRDLKSGDRIEVTGPDGAPRPFTVTSVERYPKDALPDERVFARDGTPSLALITCGGEFDRNARSYRDNVVAFAEPLG